MNISEKPVWAYPFVSYEGLLFQKADDWDIPMEQDEIFSILQRTGH